MLDGISPLVLAIVALLFLFILFFVYIMVRGGQSDIYKQLDQLDVDLRTRLDTLNKRLNVLERAVSELPSQAPPRALGVDSGSARTALTDRRLAADPSGTLRQVDSVARQRPEQPNQESQDRSRSVTDFGPATASPVDRRAEFERRAQESLESVAKFNAFVTSYSNGGGYVLDPAGQSPVPRSLEGPADKADLWAFVFDEYLEVYAGFNLLRNVALYAGDAGRPAEARLGWLFDILPGDEVRVQAPAQVSTGGWEVIRKGRLVLPL